MIIYCSPLVVNRLMHDLPKNFFRLDHSLKGVLLQGTSADLFTDLIGLINRKAKM